MNFASHFFARNVEISLASRWNNDSIKQFGAIGGEKAWPNHPSLPRWVVVVTDIGSIALQRLSATTTLLVRHKRDRSEEVRRSICHQCGLTRSSHPNGVRGIRHPDA